MPGTWLQGGDFLCTRLGRNTVSATFWRTNGTATRLPGSARHLHDDILAAAWVEEGTMRQNEERAARVLRKVLLKAPLPPTFDHILGAVASRDADADDLRAGLKHRSKMVEARRSVLEGMARQG